MQGLPADLFQLEEARKLSSPGRPPINVCLQLHYFKLWYGQLANVKQAQICRCDYQVFGEPGETWQLSNELRVPPLASHTTAAHTQPLEFHLVKTTS